jgi:hypothetical protein
MSDTIMSDTMSNIIDRFKSYSNSHPNISHCWLAYLELKKRHYDKTALTQSTQVLHLLEGGHPDLKGTDIARILLFTHSL